MFLLNFTVLHLPFLFIVSMVNYTCVCTTNVCKKFLSYYACALLSIEKNHVKLQGQRSNFKLLNTYSIRILVTYQSPHKTGQSCKHKFSQ